MHMENKLAEKKLLTLASRLRTEAHRLLYEQGLLELISSVGQARVIGSFSLNLMVWPDVDISIELPDEKDIPTFFNLGQKIAKRFKVANMLYSNQFIRTDVPFDHGLYWGIRLFHED